MEDHQNNNNNNPSPSSTSSTSSSSSNAAVGKRCRRHRRHVEEEECEVTCTGKSCQSCTAGVIADCVAVCCCPCAVVNILALAFFKLPYAVARKCIDRRKRRNRRRVLEENKRKSGGAVVAMDGGGATITGSEIVVAATGGIDDVNFGAEFKVEDVWLELFEVGHLGFGRVSFTGFPFHNNNNHNKSN